MKKLWKRIDSSTKIAFVCALACALLIVFYLLQVRGEANAKQKQMLDSYGGEQVEVCIATKDIPAGETIKESDIETKLWVASLLPENAITSKSDCLSKQLGSSILKGEVICEGRFQKQTSDLSVPDGKVALSIPVEETASVGGACKANQKIDIYATGSSTTKRIANNVLILETSDSLEKNLSSSRWITIAIDPSKTEEIVSAAQNLSLYLTLPSDSVANQTVTDEAKSQSSSKDRRSASTKPSNNSENDEKE